MKGTPPSKPRDMLFCAAARARARPRWRSLMLCAEGQELRNAECSEMAMSVLIHRSSGTHLVTLESIDAMR